MKISNIIVHIIFISMTILCSNCIYASPGDEELKRGHEYLNKKDYNNAAIQFEKSAQLGNRSGKFFYGISIEYNYRDLKNNNPFIGCDIYFDLYKENINDEISDLINEGLERCNSMLLINDVNNISYHIYDVIKNKVTPDIEGKVLNIDINMMKPSLRKSFNDYVISLRSFLPYAKEASEALSLGNMVGTIAEGFAGAAKSLLGLPGAVDKDEIYRQYRYNGQRNWYIFINEANNQGISTDFLINLPFTQDVLRSKKDGKF